jgi:hypothetical protein
VSGRGRGDAPDVTTPSLAVEVKSRRTLPAWIKYAVAQAEASARKPQLPVVVLHEDGRRYRDAIVVLKIEDFVRRLDCECHARSIGGGKEG